MRALPTRMNGPILLEPAVHRDERGFFCETFREQWREELGMPPEPFVQDNHSRSERGVVRGLHFQIGKGAAKLVRCAAGAIYDVVVDVRASSPTFRQWEGFELDDVSMRALYVPVGFAHGFCVRSETADVVYKQTAYYDPDLERTIAWNDEAIGIQWPAGMSFTVSQRDGEAPRLSEIADELRFSV